MGGTINSPENFLTKECLTGIMITVIRLIKDGFYGVWLSLVERSVRDAEVAGSNPVTPTKIIKTPCNCIAEAFFLTIMSERR